MKKVIFILTLFLSTSFSSIAQDYTTGIGLRGGFTSGVTVKHFIGGKAALEGIFGTAWRGFNFTGLYELHSYSAFDVERLNWYYGLGGHIGFWNGYAGHPWFTNNRSYTVIGVDGIVGIEYNIEEIPINISLDVKPAINLIGYTGFWFDGAFSVRYIF